MSPNLATQMLRNNSSKLQRAFRRFLPVACAGCDGYVYDNRAFCTLCRRAAPRLAKPSCATCAVPMRELYPVQTGGSQCSRCRREPPRFRTVAARWEYEGAVADAIRRIKYGSDFPALRALCREALPWFGALLHGVGDVQIIAMPSHDRELRRRGFHVPSMALSFLRDAIPDSISIDGGLRKKRPTQRQAGLSLQQRRRNVAGAFHYVKSPVDKGVALVFDDVVTTGATADAAALSLLDAGFDEVHIAALARAPARLP